MAELNQSLLREKSDTIARCLMRIKGKIPQTLDLLNADLDSQDIIILNLERATQASLDIATHIIAFQNLKTAATMSDSYVVLCQAGILSHETTERMKKAVGMRNLLVHEYTAIDWNIIWKIVQNHLNDYIAFVNEIQNWRHSKTALGIID